MEMFRYRSPRLRSPVLEPRMVTTCALIASAVEALREDLSAHGIDDNGHSFALRELANPIRKILALVVDDLVGLEDITAESD